MFRSIHNLAHKHRFLLLLFGLTILLILAWPNATLAATTAPTVNEQNVYEVINTKLGILLQFLSVITWPILFMIGGLLDSSLIFGGGMEERLLQIWTFIRNFVNIIFVLILLVIAFYNILGRTEGEYSLKQVLPKFVITLIAINFSFLICRTVVDATNVLTSAVASLPTTLLTEENENLEETAIKNICTKTDKKTGKPLMTAICSSTTTLNEFGQKFFKSVDEKNISFVMAMVSISNFDVVDQKVDDLASFLINLTGNVLIFLLFSVSYVVLFLVLLARIVVLWTMTALSPLIGLMIMLPEGVKSELSGDSDLKKIFIQHAIAPIAIVAALSIGFIMNRTLHGAPVPALIGLKLTDIHPEFKIGDIANLHELIILIATVAIIWTGVMGAASKTMAHYLTDGIKELGEKIGRFVGTSVKYLPWIPVDVDKGTGQPSDFHSVGEFGMVLDALSSGFAEKSGEKARKIAQPILGLFGGDASAGGSQGFLDAVKGDQKDRAKEELTRYIKGGGKLDKSSIVEGIRLGQSKNWYSLSADTLAKINSNATHEQIESAIKGDNNGKNLFSVGEDKNEIFDKGAKARQKTLDEEAKAEAEGEQKVADFENKLKTAAGNSDGGAEVVQLVLESKGTPNKNGLDKIRASAVPGMTATVEALQTDGGNDISQMQDLVPQLKASIPGLKPTDYIVYNNGNKDDGVDLAATHQKLIMLETMKKVADDIEKPGANSDQIIQDQLSTLQGQGLYDFLDAARTGSVGPVTNAQGKNANLKTSLHNWYASRAADIPIARSSERLLVGRAPGKPKDQKETAERELKTALQTKFTQFRNADTTGNHDPQPEKDAMDNYVTQNIDQKLTHHMEPIKDVLTEVYAQREFLPSIKTKVNTLPTNPGTTVINTADPKYQEKFKDGASDLAKELKNKTYLGGTQGKIDSLDAIAAEYKAIYGATGPEAAFVDEAIRQAKTN